MNHQTSGLPADVTKCRRPRSAGKMIRRWSPWSRFARGGIVGSTDCLGIRAEGFAEGRGCADYKIIFRLKGAMAQRAAVIGGDVERKYRQPAPRIQEQLQDETHLAAWTSPAAVCEHASSPYAEVLTLAYRSQKADRLLSLSELIWRRSPRNGAGPTLFDAGRRRFVGPLP